MPTTAARCERETDLARLSALSALKSWDGAHKGPTQLQSHPSWEWGLYVFPQETSQMLYYATSHCDRGVRSQTFSSRFLLQPSSIYHGKPSLHMKQIWTDLGSKVVLFVWSNWWFQPKIVSSISSTQVPAAERSLNISAYPSCQATQVHHSSWQPVGQ